MKIRLDITKEQWAEICAAASCCFTDNDFSKCLESLNDTNITLRFGMLVVNIIRLGQPEQVAAFVSYLQRKGYLKIDVAIMNQIRSGIWPEYPSYQLAQAIFSQESGINYFNYGFYHILELRSLTQKSELVQTDIKNIISARLAIRYKNSLEAYTAIQKLEKLNSKWLCLQIIHTYNISRLKQDYAQFTPTEIKPKTFAEAFARLLRNKSIVTYPQLISVAYQLEQQDDYHYLRWGGLVAWERSWLAIILWSLIAAASLPCLAALLVVSHGLAAPALLALGQFLLTLLPLQTLLLITTVIAGSAVFGLLAEILAPSFNLSFFRNLYYFPVSMANHFAKQGSHLITQCAYGACGFMIGLLYHPLFMTWFLIDCIISKCNKKLLALAGILSNPLTTLKSAADYAYHYIIWPKQRWQAYQIEKYWQNLLDNPSPELLSNMETKVVAISQALQSMSQQGQTSQEQCTTELNLTTQSHSRSALFFSDQTNNAATLENTSSGSTQSLIGFSEDNLLVGSLTGKNTVPHAAILL